MNKIPPSLKRLTHWTALALILAAFLFSSLGNAPLQPTPPSTPTPQPVLIAPGPTALPAEYFRTQDQSSLITAGAVVLVLIILFSALGVLLVGRRHKNP